jgi:serine/threonine-protein kinase HSL1 (negative regulator of Swe1 kinase)
MLSYLVMEYVEGGELYGHIDKHRCLPEFEAVRIFRQIISALGYCHRLNIYHRDLKPENILLDANQNVKLVDFGMAALQPQGKWLKTSCGSPHYAAPEIAWGHKYQGAPVDVWSSGVVLYAMLIGRLPFGSGQEGEDPKEVLKDVVRGEVTIPEDVSEEAEDLILRMLQLNPEDRITIDLIWEHPLIRKYEPFTRHQKYASKWIGGPPPLLTEKDCGTQLRHRSEIDPELLKNLCSLWQYPDEEILIAILLSDK